MKFYVQLQDDNRVTDIIARPYGGYVEVDLALPFPMDAFSGEYQLVGNELIYRADWVPLRDENGNVIAADDTEGQMRYFENLYFETYIKRDLLDAEFSGEITAQTDGREALKSKIMALRDKLNGVVQNEENNI